MFPNILIELKKRRYSQQGLAKYIGISRSSIKLNGTSQGAWDGSSAKTIDITAASVGATNVTLRRW